MINRMIYLCLCLTIFLGIMGTAKAEEYRFDFVYIFKANNDLSNLNEGFQRSVNLKESMGIDVVTVDHFPAYKIPTFELYLQTKSGFEVGVSYAKFSTGSAMMYADYSGELKETWDLATNKYGLSLRYNLNTSLIDSRITTKFGCYVNYIDSEMSIDYSVDLGVLSQTQSEFVDFSEYLIEPFVQLLYDFDYCQVGFNLGYSIVAGRKYNIEREGVRQGIVVSVGL